MTSIPYNRYWNTDKDILSLDKKIDDKTDVIKLLSNIKKLEGISDILSFEKIEKYDRSYLNPLSFKTKKVKMKNKI